MASSLDDKMTPAERRAGISLAAIFALRMLGLFLILPVFAVHAHGMPGGDNTMLVGMAFGAYGLTQAFLQIPFGTASDRFGRKPVIVFGLLLFVAGSVVAAGRNLQQIEADIAARLKDNRLANVTPSWSMFDKLDAADGSVDVVTWFQGPHELYCAKDCGNIKMGKLDDVFKEVSRILKPGGTFVIIDHAVPVGTPTTSGNAHSQACQGM